MFRISSSLYLRFSLFLTSILLAIKSLRTYSFFCNRNLSYSCNLCASVTLRYSNSLICCTLTLSDKVIFSSFGVERGDEPLLLSMLIRNCWIFLANPFFFSSSYFWWIYLNWSEGKLMQSINYSIVCSPSRYL